MSPVDIDRVIADLATRQHGAVSRDQLNFAGIHRAAIRHRIRTGALVEPTSQVVALRGAPGTDHLRVMVAVLDAGPGACTSHGTTLALVGIPGFRLDPIHVSQPRGGIFRDHRGVVLHTSRRIPPEQIAVVDDIPSTTATRALFDIAASVHPGRLERALDAAWTRGLTDHRRLSEALEALSCRGRSGIRIMRELIEARGPEYIAPESGVEGRFHQIVDDDGQPPLERQVRWQAEIGEVRFDAFDDRALVDFEIDSALHHRSITDEASDERRDAAVRATGVQVERIPDEDIWHRPDDVARRVRRARGR